MQSGRVGLIEFSLAFSLPLLVFPKGQLISDLWYSYCMSNVHFKCNWIWYVHSDVLAMGASLAVLLANVWMKFSRHHCKYQSSVKISPDPTNSGSAKTVTEEWISEEEE